MGKNLDFSVRFAEACGTSEPAKIQRLLNIPYQSAKNYLEGRFPESSRLIDISARTSCSIDWLLTGRGKKFIDLPKPPDTPLATGQMEAFVRRICVEVINERSGSQEPAESRIVVLRSSELMSEKTENTVPSMAENQQ